VSTSSSKNSISESDPIYLVEGEEVFGEMERAIGISVMGVGDDDPNIVKVVLDQQSNALYFSRSSIPFPRKTTQLSEEVSNTDANSTSQPLQILRHKGIYGFTRSFLLKFVSWKPSPLEICEQLEQLRALENGAKITVIITSDDSPGIDTPEQADILHRQFLTE